MKKLLIATKNPGKLHEIKSFLKDLKIIVLSLSDVGIDDDVEENGKTYEENSKKKALFYAKLSNLPALSDDGGFEIEALGWAPGVKSRRWLGFDATDEELIEHMKKVIISIPRDKRKARFKTVVSFAMPDGRVWSEEGVVGGIVTDYNHAAKVKGYPYRSFFYLPQIQKYYLETELTPSEQKKYNHRYRALAKLKPILRRVILNSFQDLHRDLKEMPKQVRHDKKKVC